MHSRIASSFVLALLPVAACTTYGNEYQVGAEDYVLASHVDEDGLRQTYSLDVRSSTGDATLQVTTETRDVRASLGLRVDELKGRRAEDRGVKPYTGLLVARVLDESAAEAAGIEAGDVLLSLDGRATVYEDQLEQVEKALRPDQVVTARILRGQSEQELTLTTRTRELRSSRSESVPLDSVPPPLRPYAGVSLRGVPAVWCERIWGKPREAVVVTSVVVGSPAWLAGVRGGDVLEELDGAPVPPVAEVLRRIGELGPSGGAMRWRLRRAEQLHDATIELDDYSGETNVWVPFVFGLQSSAYHDRWSIGPFGLLLSNRNHYLPNTSTRAVQTRNVFSALLGLFHVESRPDETEVRLLWIIRFDT